MKYNTLLLILVISLFGCSGGDGEEKNAISSIEILTEQSDVIVGERIDLSVFGNDGTNLTNSATFFVDNSEIIGSSFTPNLPGTYWIYATYQEFKSSTKTVTVNEDQSASYTKKVLIEDYTGTWCGWCPRISYSLEQLESQTDNLIVVSVHRGASDPYNFTESNIGDLDEGVYPTGKINRTTTWSYPENSNLSQVMNLLGSPSKIGLSIDSSIETNTMKIDIGIGMSKNYTSLKLVVYVVEDKLYYDQANYTSFYDGVSTIPNFEHNGVLRKSLTDVFGISINSSGKTEVIKSFEASVPSNISEVENVKIIAFVVDNGGTVLNSQVTKLGTSKDYDL